MGTQLNRIMCTTDFSDYGNQTVFYGIALAKVFNAKLYVCHVIDIAFVDIYGESLLNPVEQRKRITTFAHEQIKALMADRKLEWEPLVVVGRPEDEISRLVEEHKADMVIAASHGRAGLKHFILGSVTERLMRTLRCPLLILRPMNQTSGISEYQEIELKRILVGCDFSPDSDLAFEYALNLAQRFRAELHLVHVMTVAIHKYTWLESSFESREQFDQEIKARYKEKMQKMVPEEALSWCRPYTELLIGQPHKEMNKYVNANNIDLIVLGTRGAGIIETLFVGSTTDRLVRQAKCPVLSVCHKD